MMHESRTGTKSAMKSEIQEEVPWSNNLTGYDQEHFTLPEMRSGDGSRTLGFDQI